MKYRCTSSLLFCVLICLLSGCKNEVTGDPVKGLYCDVADFPSIDSFSGTEYQDHQYDAYPYQFPPVLSAVLKYNETEEVIAPNDERLIRLLNFLTFSEEKHISAYQTGYLEEAEILDCLAADAPMLEVCFDYKNANNESAQGKTPKIVICGDSYLAFVDSSSPNWVWAGSKDGLYADRYWPYGGPIMELEKSTGAVLLSFEGWGLGYWIDLLEYAGFYE